MDSIIALLIGGIAGLWVGVTFTRTCRDRDPDWRRSFNHENINKPSGLPPLRLDPGRQQRCNNTNFPETPKPSIVPTPQSAPHQPILRP